MLFNGQYTNTEETCLDRLLFFLPCTLLQNPATVTEKRQQLGYLGAGSPQEANRDASELTEDSYSTCSFGRV